MDTRKLADHLADELFRIPENGGIIQIIGPDDPKVCRIQFMAGVYPDREFNAGGLNKRTLADRLQGILQRYDEATN